MAINITKSWSLGYYYITRFVYYYNIYKSIAVANGNIYRKVLALFNMVAAGDTWFIADIYRRIITAGHRLTLCCVSMSLPLGTRLQKQGARVTLLYTYNLKGKARHTAFAFARSFNWVGIIIMSIRDLNCVQFRSIHLLHSMECHFILCEDMLSANAISSSRCGCHRNSIA